MNDHPYHKLLHAEPVPPTELHPLLKYLSDAFALLEDWILRPDEDDPCVLQIGSRAHPTKNDKLSLYVTTRSHLSAAAGDGRVRLFQPCDDEGRPGWSETYELNADGAAELLRDVGLRAVLRTEARSQWNTWTRQTRPPEEIRIALRDAPGYYVQCPLDSDGKPMHMVATLEFAIKDEDQDGPRTREVAVNQETERLLRMLVTCVSPLTP